MSDRSIAPPSALQSARNAWVERVLGVSPRVGAPVGPLNAALIEATRRIAPPEDLDALTDELVKLAPEFFAALIDEPEKSANVLGVGAMLPAQDQMTSIAGLIDLFGRKLDEWARALDNAEEAKAWVEHVDPASVDPEEYASAVKDYDEHRTHGLAIEDEVAAMANRIRAECAGFSESVGRGAKS